MKSPVASIYLSLSAIALLIPLPTSALTIVHSGSTDPTLEGFAIATYSNPSTVGPLADDLGRSAWRITNSSTSSQLVYYSGVTSAQKDEITSGGGYTLTFEARVLQGATPSFYDNTNHITLGGVHFDNGAKRFEVNLGLNSDGDTVVVLPTSIDNGGPGSTIRSPGPSFTLTGSGNIYHTFQLRYSSATDRASLSVDGISRIDNYAGHTSFVANRGVTFHAFSGAEVHYSSVQFVSVPAPSALFTVLVGIVPGAGLLWRRRLRRKV